MIVHEVTILCHHLGAMHSAKYRIWAKSADFESKLPEDIKQRKIAATAATQRILDRHLSEQNVTERLVPYSNKLFRQTAIEWVVATDQVNNSSPNIISFNL
jgi:hypothetical protein